MVKKLINCTQEFWEFVRVLRMDERVIGGFLETQPITEEQQTKYMINNAYNYRICLVDEIPAGYVGVIEDDIRICTHPDFQNMGIAKFMIIECMKIWPTAHAKVKLGNTASDKLFISCGFEVSGIDTNFTYYNLKKW